MSQGSAYLKHETFVYSCGRVKMARLLSCLFFEWRCGAKKKKMEKNQIVKKRPFFLFSFFLAFHPDSWFAVCSRGHLMLTQTNCWQQRTYSGLTGQVPLIKSISVVANQLATKYRLKHLYLEVSVSSDITFYHVFTNFVLLEFQAQVCCLVFIVLNLKDLIIAFNPLFIKTLTVNVPVM